jgi:hypothetical protein
MTLDLPLIHKANVYEDDPLVEIVPGRLLFADELGISSTFTVLAHICGV